MKPLLLLALIAAPAMAEEREYCPERPGLNTPACIIDAGHASVETNIADWTLTKDAGAREDQLLIGDTELRIGLTNRVEAQVSWTPFGHDRRRDGGVDVTNGVGDVTLGLKANLSHPDGSGFAAAVLPFVTLPVGRQGIGAGDWGAGLLVPLTYQLSDTVQLEATPEIDAAVDADGDGRHLAYGSAVGLALKVAEPVTLTGEVQVQRDRDPAGHTTQALAALSAGWMARKNLQLYLLGAKGLNGDSPDVEVYGGVAVRF